MLLKRLWAGLQIVVAILLLIQVFLDLYICFFAVEQVDQDDFLLTQNTAFKLKSSDKLSVTEESGGHLSHVFI